MREKEFNLLKKEEGSSENKLNLLERFVQRVRTSFLFLQNKPQSDIQLAGRIQDLHKTAASVQHQLRTIKEHLKEEVDSEFFLFVEAIIDPMIKDLSRIKKSMDEPGSITQQAQVFKRYSQWIEKAKVWIHLCSKTNDKEAILRSVVNLTIEEFLEVINRDLQVIQDYQEHVLDNLASTEEERINITDQFESKLAPYVKSLIDLKKRPQDLPVKEIKQWKAKVDKRREKYFDGALHAIDKLVALINPSATSEEEHDHLVEILSQIAYLEKEIPALNREVITADLSDEFQKQILESRFLSLEEEVHKLNLDLRLTPDLIDRLQALTDILNIIYDRLLHKVV